MAGHETENVIEAIVIGARAARRTPGADAQASRSARGPTAVRRARA